MRLDVPFYKQTTALNCGPTTLKMVLSYFGKKEPIKSIEKKTEMKELKGISTIQIAIAATSLGYHADFYSKHILFNEDNLNYEFYKQYSDINLEESEKYLEKAKNLGVNIKEKTLSLDNLLSLLTKNSIPIVLLDWNIIKTKKENGYQGHFVPIVGFDKQNVYIHNPGLNDAKEFMSISRRIFNKARKAKGTDEDIVIVYRKGLQNK